jgi:hypothetical protein
VLGVETPPPPPVDSRTIEDLIIPGIDNLLLISDMMNDLINALYM